MLHHISNQLYLFTNTHYLFVQETSLLLGNLVDVLDEIKFAKIKFLNLTSAAFVLESQTGLFSIPYIQCIQFTCVHLSYSSNNP
jgi:hypothetical protein